jgi:DNA-directed RNA polymerase beta subunit
MDVPFTVNGIRPDVMFNPHGLPSRMTVGYLLELLAGKVGCLRGKPIDATSFSGESKKELEEQLKTLGFRFDGKETVYIRNNWLKNGNKNFRWKSLLLKALNIWWK